MRSPVVLQDLRCVLCLQVLSFYDPRAPPRKSDPAIAAAALRAITTPLYTPIDTGYITSKHMMQKTDCTGCAFAALCTVFGGLVTAGDAKAKARSFAPGAALTTVYQLTSPKTHDCIVPYANQQPYQMAMRVVRAQIRPFCKQKQRSVSKAFASLTSTSKMAPAAALEGPKDVTIALEKLNKEYEQVQCGRDVWVWGAFSSSAAAPLRCAVPSLG